jgi:hypothetical protein
MYLDNNSYANIRTQSIEVTVTNAGITTIPNQAQLQGMIINSIQILSNEVCVNTPITNVANAVDASYVKRMVFNFKKRSDEIFMYMPAAYLNPFVNLAGVPGIQNREIFFPQYIDFNQSQIQINDFDNALTYPFTVCLQICYTDEQKLPSQMIPTNNNVSPTNARRRNG